jgi:hypothetical protein
MVMKKWIRRLADHRIGTSVLPQNPFLNRLTTNRLEMP